MKGVAWEFTEAKATGLELAGEREGRPVFQGTIEQIMDFAWKVSLRKLDAMANI